MRGVAEQHLAKAKVLIGRAKGDAALDKLAAEIGEQLFLFGDRTVERFDLFFVFWFLFSTNVTFR